MAPQFYSPSAKLGSAFFNSSWSLALSLSNTSLNSTVFNNNIKTLILPLFLAIPLEEFHLAS